MEKYKVVSVVEKVEYVTRSINLLLLAISTYFNYKHIISFNFYTLIFFISHKITKNKIFKYCKSSKKSKRYTTHRTSPTVHHPKLL